MKRVVKVKVKTRGPALSQEDVIAHVRSSGERGLTARELSKLLGHEDAVTAARALARCEALRSEFTPCADHKTHYAVQESRYWTRQ